MLQRMRDNSQSFLSKIIIGLIIGVFALFGAESIVGGFFNPQNVATVNGEEITEQELNGAIQRLMSNLGSQVSSFDDADLRDIALEQLVENRVLMQTAEDSGLVISGRSIDQQILNSPQFQINGRFDSDYAARTMATQGFNPSGYRAALADQMLITQLATAYSASAFVPQAALERIAALLSQTRDFRFLSVPTGSRTMGEAIAEEDIEAFYENNTDRFMREEQVSVNYVMLRRDQLYDEFEVSEERVRQAYEEARDEASGDEERRAAHILLETGGDRSEEEAVELAGELRARIEDGESFADLAQEYSDDVVSARDGGDIGYSDGSVFPDAVEEALRGLEVEEVSAPVVSEFGVHLVKLTEYDFEEYPSFEERAEEIERELVESEVDEVWFSSLERLANLAFETFDLESVASEMDLPIQESPFFGESGGPDDITGNEQVIEAAFSGEVLYDDLNSDLIELGDERALVLHLDEHRPEAVRPLEEVRDEIAATLRSQRERELAREIGERILSRLESGESIDDLVEEEGLEWREVTDASRNSGQVNPQVAQLAFSIRPPEGDDPVRQGGSLDNGTYVVVELHAVAGGSLDSLPEQQREQLVQVLNDHYGRRGFDALLANRRTAADIERRASDFEFGESGTAPAMPGGAPQL
ncbi:MAG: SurA N-terminal domain-containing protein [Pseudohongiellaceae bacterium]